MNDHYMLKIHKYMQNHSKIASFVVCMEKITTMPVVFIFYGTVAYLIINLDIRVFKVAIIPWLGFFVTNLIGKKLNLKRPFEELDFPSLVPHSKGKSCPSRHATSSTVISIAVYTILPNLGIFLAFVTILVCVARVLVGVHYVRDVCCGIIVGLCVGSLFML